MEFVLEENMQLRNTIKRIVQKIEMLEKDKKCLSEREEALREVKEIIETEAGVTYEEILHPKCQ